MFENYRFDVRIRGIKIISQKNPERCKLSHWWEPSLNEFSLAPQKRFEIRF